MPGASRDISVGTHCTRIWQRHSGGGAEAGQPAACPPAAAQCSEVQLLSVAAATGPPAASSASQHAKWPATAAAPSCYTAARSRAHAPCDHPGVRCRRPCRADGGAPTVAGGEVQGSPAGGRAPGRVGVALDQQRKRLELALLQPRAPPLRPPPPRRQSTSCVGLRGGLGMAHTLAAW
jgi:hypothetical protein